MPKIRRRASGRRGISRIDQPSTRTHGFFARLGWYKKRDGSYGPRYKAFFGDISHGGKTRALKAAQAWVKETDAKIRKTERKKASRTTTRRRRAA